VPPCAGGNQPARAGGTHEDGAGRGAAPADALSAELAARQAAAERCARRAPNACCATRRRGRARTGMSARRRYVLAAARLVAAGLCGPRRGDRAGYGWVSAQLATAARHGLADALLLAEARAALAAGDVDAAAGVLQVCRGPAQGSHGALAGVLVACVAHCERSVSCSKESIYTGVQTH